MLVVMLSLMFCGSGWLSTRYYLYHRWFTISYHGLLVLGERYLMTPCIYTQGGVFVVFAIFLSPGSGLQASAAGCADVLYRDRVNRLYKIELAVRKCVASYLYCRGDVAFATGEGWLELSLFVPLSRLVPAPKDAPTGF